MNDFQNVGRPPGAEEHETALQAAAVHTETSRESRVNDVLFNVGYFEQIAIDEGIPLSFAIERDVAAAGDSDLPILLACLQKKGFQVKEIYGRQSTGTHVLQDDETLRKLVNAYSTDKAYNTLFGGIEQRKLEAASTRDGVPQPSAANPSLATPLKDRKRIAEYSFGLEDVYADVITTDLSQIDEIVFENEDAEIFEMYLRKELGDIKTASVTISTSKNQMTQMAIALRWSDKFAKNQMRMSVVDRWQTQVAIRARNALRNLGIKKIGRDGTPLETKIVAGGKTRANLFGMGFELGDAYPTNMLVMDVTTIKGWLAPGATPNVVTTVVDDDMGFRLINNVAPNTNLGVVSDNLWDTATNNKIVNYVRDLTLDLYVENASFATEVSYNPDNKSYKATVTFDFVPVFIDRSGRIVWTIA